MSNSQDMRPKKVLEGMDKDGWGINGTQYYNALNLVIESTDGGKYIAKNDTSNILTAKITEGFKINGYKVIPSTREILLMLVNEDSGISEIGVIKVRPYEEEMSYDDCNKCEDLGDKLEDIEQVAYSYYHTILSDECSEHKFGFKLNYPIKNIVIKEENSDIHVYFTDGSTHPRVVNITNTRQYFLKNVHCEDEEVLSCPDLERTRQFKDANPPRIKASHINTGGEVQESVLQYFVKYCDKFGNDVTEVLAGTSALNLFNKTQIARDVQVIKTNYSIALTVDKLDKRYDNYKVLLRQSFPSTINEGGSTFRVFQLGIYSTEQNSVLHYTTDNLIELDDSSLLTGRRYVETTDVNTGINKTLVHSGITEFSIPSLQKVVNLAGQFVKWKTFSAKEDLYNDSVASSLYIGYNRGEVVPLSISFTTNKGYKTPKMPLISRAMEKGEDAFINNKDSRSLSETDKCVQVDRDQMWQFYNTAYEVYNEDCDYTDVEYTDVTDTVEKVGVIERVFNTTDLGLGRGHFTVSTENNIRNLNDFLSIIQELPESECSDMFIETNYPLCRILHETFPTKTVDPNELYEGIVCDSISEDRVEIQIREVEGNVKEELIESVFPIDYMPMVKVANSTMFMRGLKKGERDEIQWDPYGLRINWTMARYFNRKRNNSNDERLAAIIYEENKCGVYKREPSTQAFDPIYANEALKLIDPKKKDREFTYNNMFYEDGVGLTDRFHNNLFPEEKVKSQKDIYFNINLTEEELEDLDKRPGGQPTKEDYETKKGNFTIYIGDKKYDSGLLEEEDRTLSKAIDNFLAVNTVDIGNDFPTIDIYMFKYSYNIGFVAKSFEDPVPEIKVVVRGDFTYHIQEAAMSNANAISEKANWFWVNPEDSLNEFIIDVSAPSEEMQKVDYDYFVRIYNNSTETTRRDVFDYKLSLFLDADDKVAVFSKNVAYYDGIMLKLTRIGNTKNMLLETDKGDNKILYGVYSKKGYLVCFDTLTTPAKENKVQYLTVPTPGGYSVTWRPKEYKELYVEYDNISFDKLQYFNAECEFKQPILNSCGVVPNRVGKFSYWESIENYPDNKYLFDSSNLEVNKDSIPLDIKKEFLEKFSELNSGDRVVLSDSADFRCKPIRHFKFPDNSVANIINKNKVKSFGDSTIQILGISINEEHINFFLDMAVENNIISKKDRDTIIGYEIYRGDIDLDRSIHSAGLMFDMRSYSERDNKILYPNYPYNTFGKDVFNNTTTPGFGISNSTYTFHSPETDYNGTVEGTEMDIQGVQYGTSVGNFEEVEEHPKWTILTPRARQEANRMANRELASELLINLAHITSRAFAGFFAGMMGGVIVPWGSIAGGAMLAGANVMMNGKKERYLKEWLDVYENMGFPINFAYYYHSVGKYNYMEEVGLKGERLRALSTTKFIGSGKFKDTDIRTGETYYINNKSRESAAFLNTGTVGIQYSTYGSFSKYDSDSNSSMFRADKGFYNGKNISVDITKNIASMYSYLKTYKPGQFGELNAVKWIHTGHSGDLRLPKSCTQIFGGDTFIVRHSVKRKHRQFNVDYMKPSVGDKTPIDYKFYNNIGENPTYYCKYKMSNTADDSDRTDSSEYFFDTKFDNDSKSGKYYVAPSKFYLYYYGIPYFMCESRINTNLRFTNKEATNDFYPNTTDISALTQEDKVPIGIEARYFFNSVYLQSGLTRDVGRYKSTYDPEAVENSKYKKNLAIYSDTDNNEFGSNDPWLSYKPNNVYFSDSSWGKLRGFSSLKDEAFVGLYSSKSVLFNAVDSVVDVGNDNTLRNFGDGRMFSRRIRDFSNSDFGFGGSTGYTHINTEFGHFHLNCSKGEVYQIVGNQIFDINRINSQGQPTKMFNWFKENLPFKILKSGIEGIETVDLDNALNGLGVTLGYDSRFKKIFITKRDFVPKVKGIEYRGHKFYFGGKEVKLSDNTKFKDVSFTIAYNLEGGNWSSFFSFKPEGYVSFDDTFYTIKGEGIWGHNLTNKSYQVYYGELHPFEIEYTLDKNTGRTLAIREISFDLYVRRYLNKFDYIDLQNKIFDKICVHGHNTNSGELIPILTNGTMDFELQFPKRSKDYSKMEILASKDNEGRTFINYLFDRNDKAVKNQPIWYHDENQISKRLNYTKVNFKPKDDELIPLRTNIPRVILTQEKESRLSYSLDLTYSKAQVIDN